MHADPCPIMGAPFVTAPELALDDEWIVILDADEPPPDGQLIDFAPVKALCSRSLQKESVSTVQYALRSGEDSAQKRMRYWRRSFSFSYVDA